MGSGLGSAVESTGYGDAGVSRKRMPGIRVLIVDDDPDITGFIKLRLAREARHFSIDAVESGRECLDFIRRNRVDCILSDYQMPDMNGMELLEALRGQGYDTPFIFITGQGNEEVAREAFKKGANDYFTKDIGFAHFPRVINSVEQAVRHRLAADDKAAAERAFVEEKNKLEAMFASIPDGLSMVGPDFTILYQNARQTEMVGSHAGETCYRAYHGRDEVCEGCQVAMVFEDGKTHTVQRELTRNGRKLYLENTASPVRDADGNIVACLEIVRNITEQKKAVQDLRKLTLAVEQSASMVVITDPAGLIEYVNPSFTKLTGFSPEEVTGTHASRLGELPPDERERLWNTIRAGGNWKGEFHNWKKDGGMLWVIASMSPIRDENGVITHYVSSQEDITERKKAEDALRQSEEFLESVVESIQDGIIVLDRELNILRLNPAIEHMFPGRGHVVGGKCYEGLLDSGEPCVDCPSVTTLRTGKASRLERARKLPGGGVTWEELFSFPLKDKSTGEVRGVIEFIRDITERKKAQEELMAVKTKLEMLLAHNPAVVYSGRADEYFSPTFISENVRENYGYEPKEFLDNPEFWMGLLHPDDAGRVMEGARELFEKGQHVDEYRFLHKDGSYRWVRDYVNLLRDNEGNPAQIVGCMLDIDEIKRHAIRKEEFYSMVSHDLKSPLVAIHGYSELILEGGVPSEDLPAMASAISSSCRKVLGFLDDFMDISRFDAGKLMPSREHVDINRLIGEVADELSIPAGKKGLDVRLEKAEGLSTVRADERLVHRAVHNLMQNAVSFTPRGGRVTVRTETAEEEGREFAVVEVSDTGPGIPPEEQSEIFNMYYRSARTSGVKGSGIGLAVVKAFAEAHGGKVTVASEEGRGAVFRFYLPMQGG